MILKSLERLTVKHTQVGIITTYFSKQFFSKYLNLYEIPSININEYIEINKITAVIIDNDLYEEDHNWYGREVGGLLSILKLYNVELFFVRNSDKQINNTYREHTVINIDINKEVAENNFHNRNIDVPLIVDEVRYNPVNSIKKIDTLYLNKGKLSRNNEVQLLQDRLQPIRKEIVFDKITRKLITDIIENIKFSKIVYIYKADSLDRRFLKYLEIIAILQHTVVILNSESIESEYIINNEDALNINYMATIKEDGIFTDKLLLPLQRSAFLNHSFVKYSSLKNIFEGQVNNPFVSVITSTNRKEYLGRYIAQLNEQKEITIEVILVAHGLKFNDKEKEELLNQSNFDFTIIEADSSEHLGYCLNLGILKAKYSYIAKIDDDDFYFENYLLDAWLAKSYSKADLVGKHSTFTYLDSTKVILKNHVNSVRKYQKFVMGATFFCSRSFISKYMFSDLPTGEDSDFLRRINNDNAVIYTDHPYNFCIFRSNNVNTHTWKRNDIEFFKNAKIVHHGTPDKIVSI